MPAAELVPASVEKWHSTDNVKGFSSGCNSSGFAEGRMSAPPACIDSGDDGKGFCNHEVHFARMCVCRYADVRGRCTGETDGARGLAVALLFVVCQDLVLQGEVALLPSLVVGASFLQDALALDKGWNMTRGVSRACNQAYTKATPSAGIDDRTQHALDLAKIGLGSRPLAHAPESL